MILAWLLAQAEIVPIDQIYWVPTMAQAELAAKATGRPIMAIITVGGNWNAPANGMIHVENREFVLDQFGMVKPYSEHFICVKLDYYPQRQIWGGQFWKDAGGGVSVGEQFLIDQNRKILEGHHCHKNGTGFSPAQLEAIGSKFPKKNVLKLSWFVMDNAMYQADVPEKKDYYSAESAVLESRLMRRPLVRVDGSAIASLESNQEFLTRHVRQFCWLKGDPSAPAKLVVLNTNDCSDKKIPAVMATLDPANPGAALDECWRKYMENRPSNADFMSFAQELIPKFKAADEAIRKLAKEGKLLAPGGRPLLKKIK